MPVLFLGDMDDDGGIVSSLTGNTFRPNRFLLHPDGFRGLKRQRNGFAPLFQHFFAQLPCLKYNHEVFRALVGRFG